MRKKKRKKENKVIERTEHGARGSLGDNRSQGGNGLLHLIHVPGRELEHGRNGGLLGELQFLQGLVSGLDLNQSQKSWKISPGP